MQEKTECWLGTSSTNWKRSQPDGVSDRKLTLRLTAICDVVSVSRPFLTSAMPFLTSWRPHVLGLADQP